VLFCCSNNICFNRLNHVASLPSYLWAGQGIIKGALVDCDGEFTGKGAGVGAGDSLKSN